MSSAPGVRGALGQWRWTVLSVVACAAFLACFVRIGADWDWLVALGDHVRTTGQVPDRVPFAVADTGGWHNVPVLAELTASAMHGVGDAAPVLAHLAAVVTTLVVLAVVVRARGAGDAHAAAAVALVVLGGLASLAVVRAQSYSLVLFVLLLALVCSQARTPDRRIWWAVPLVALWGNLHGAALLGVCVLGAYLLVQRTRTHLTQSIAVGATSLLALCATPQLWHTPAYYATVFDNVSAQRAEGLWARPSLDSPFDVVMIAAALVLLVVFLRRRRAAWEYVAVLGLCVATASAARHGIWLVCVLAVLAAGRPDNGAPERADRSRHQFGSAVVVGIVAFAVALPVVLARGEAVLGQPSAVVRTVVATAGDDVVLAPTPLSETLAVEGVRLWAANPLDAFTHRDQAAYLDFLDGSAGARSAVDAVDVVVAREDSPQAALVEDDAAFSATDCGAGWTCFVRR
ncbi:hypothetical protein ASG76_09330 [Nocardioides sp. Soil774]|uniref:hypothetical protein n=1 Tax=Nocardioides sp. Soil774 TaxID=1736408 RepID=UPI0006F4EA69|nr:hypothetical protein [Nocardioides sp. Soil774]KRE94610.1 hypothetical protein ASG76_09330 [Nocardioides sp. Soil774]